MIPSTVDKHIISHVIGRILRTPKSINTNALYGHKRLLQVWAGVVLVSLLLFFGLLIFSYFALGEGAATVHNDAAYRRGAAIFGALELECLAIATLAFLRYRYVKSKHRKLVFHKLLADNKWSASNKFMIDKVAAILLGPGSSSQETEYAFHARGSWRDQRGSAKRIERTIS